MSANPRELLRSHGIRPDKRLGQHFLCDGDVAAREIEHAGIDRGETVLEIGPGLGVLTRLAAPRCRRLIAYEASRELCELLRRDLPSNVEVRNEDFLQAEAPPADVVISNVPYNISSPLAFKLLDLGFGRAVLMFQKEFAERLVAAHGSKDYSRLSVKVYMKADAELLETVPRSAFWPEPKVDSAVVRLRPRPAPFEPQDPALFDGLVDLLFSHRRKKIATTLRKEASRLSMSKEAVEKVRGRIPHGERRVEELSPEQIEEIAAFLKGH